IPSTPRASPAWLRRLVGNHEVQASHGGSPGLGERPSPPTPLPTLREGGHVGIPARWPARLAGNVPSASRFPAGQGRALVASSGGAEIHDFEGEAFGTVPAVAAEREGDVRSSQGCQLIEALTAVERHCPHPAHYSVVTRYHVEEEMLS